MIGIVVLDESGGVQIVRVDKLVGPSYKDVAAKYKADKNAPATLAKKIREGGVGTWGQVAMPANPQVNEQEAATLAKWVLSQ